MQGMVMPSAHRLSQSGQWQQLQSQWEQQQRQLQHQHNQPHYYQPNQQPHSADYYSNDQPHQPAYPPYPRPPPHTALAVPPLLLRIAVSPTQTVDLPIDVTATTDVTAIAQHFCRTHNIDGDSKLHKLHAMIERSVEQHRQQYTVVQSAGYYAPYAGGGQYEDEYGGGYYGEQQAYAEQYGGQYAMQQSTATTPPPQPSQSTISDSDDLSPLQPTFTPSRPTSAMSHHPAAHHSRHQSTTASSVQQHLSHSQPTPTVRPASLTLPSSSSATPSPHSSPRPISPLSAAGYLNAPASARLYANAAIKQRQLARHALQRQQLESERQQLELQQCTFAPNLTSSTSTLYSSSSRVQQSERRQRGKKQYEWIEDWNGEKREQRLQRMRELEKKRFENEGECSFTPIVNAVSHQLVQLNKSNPSNHRKKESKPKQSVDTDKVKKVDAEAKMKITQFLQRTIERQQSAKQTLSRLQADNVKHTTPTFVPHITTKAHNVQPAYNKPTTAQHDRTGSGSGSVVVASEKKRQRRCVEMFRCFGDSDGYIDRSGWLRLVKCWYMRDSSSSSSSGSRGSSRRLESMRWQLELDDVAVIQMMIRECDRQVRRDRKAGSVDGTGSSSEEYTWQLSLADFQLWMERLWRVVLDRAATAEREEGRMVHKFTPAPDP